MRGRRVVHAGFGDRLLRVIDLLLIREQLQVALWEDNTDTGVVTHVVGLAAFGFQLQLIIAELAFAAQFVAFACIEIEQEKALVVGVAEALVIQINLHRVKAVEPTVAEDVDVGFAFRGRGEGLGLYDGRVLRILLGQSNTASQHQESHRHESGKNIAHVNSPRIVEGKNLFGGFQTS